MESREIRHLPVMSGSHLKGIISQRDILEERARVGTALDDVSLESVCRTDVLSVGPLTPISEVARQMLSEHRGSAVVVDGGYVVGIFTTIDALRVLEDLSDL